MSRFQYPSISETLATGIGLGQRRRALDQNQQSQEDEERYKAQVLELQRQKMAQEAGAMAAAKRFNFQQAEALGLFGQPDPRMGPTGADAQGRVPFIGGGTDPETFMGLDPDSQTHFLDSARRTAESQQKQVAAREEAERKRLEEERRWEAIDKAGIGAAIADPNQRAAYEAWRGSRGEMNVPFGVFKTPGTETSGGPTATPEYRSGGAIGAQGDALQEPGMSQLGDRMKRNALAGGKPRVIRAIDAEGLVTVEHPDGRLERMIPHYAVDAGAVDLTGTLDPRMAPGGGGIPPYQSNGHVGPTGAAPAATATADAPATPEEVGAAEAALGPAATDEQIADWIRHERAARGGG